MLAFIGRRSITIYVWLNFAIGMTPLVLERSPLAPYYAEDVRGHPLEFGTAWVLILSSAVLVGWAEDLGTGRRHGILTRGRVRAPQPAPVLNMAVDVQPYPEPKTVAHLEPYPEPSVVVDMGHRSTASARTVETQRDGDEVSPSRRSVGALGRPATVATSAEPTGPDR